MQHVQVWTAPESRAHEGPGTRRFAWVWLAGIAIAWWAVTQRQLADAGLGEVFAGMGKESTGAPVAVFAVASVAGRGVGLALEALFYLAWWRSCGAPFRFGRFFCSIATLSLIDAWAVTIRMLVRDHAEWLAPWIAPFAGLDLLRDGSSAGVPSLEIAFGSFGLATVARIALTARAQSIEARCGFTRPVLITSAAWLASRVVTWWSLDLARGASPMP